MVYPEDEDGPEDEDDLSILRMRMVYLEDEDYLSRG